MIEPFSMSLLLCGISLLLSLRLLSLIFFNLKKATERDNVSLFG